MIRRKAKPLYIRLLIRGHRVANEIVDDPSRVTADGVQVQPVLVAPAIAVPLLIVVVAIQFADDRRQKAWGEDDENEP